MKNQLIVGEFPFKHIIYEGCLILIIFFNLFEYFNNGYSFNRIFNSFIILLFFLGIFELLRPRDIKFNSKGILLPISFIAEKIFNKKKYILYNEIKKVRLIGYLTQNKYLINFPKIQILLNNNNFYEFTIFDKHLLETISFYRIEKIINYELLKSFLKEILGNKLEEKYLENYVNQNYHDKNKDKPSSIQKIILIYGIPFVIILLLMLIVIYYYPNTLLLILIFGLTAILIDTILLLKSIDNYLFYGDLKNFNKK